MSVDEEEILQQYIHQCEVTGMESLEQWKNHLKQVAKSEQLGHLHESPMSLYKS